VVTFVSAALILPARMSAPKSTRPPRRRSTPSATPAPSENRTARSFVAAGSGEAREGGPSYEGRIIRRGDQSPEALREKAGFVLRAIGDHNRSPNADYGDKTNGP
jgi:hypothetical protein